ncbi:MAG: 7-carboxy-7-deazaguanine synthase QueE [Bdellovibrio sp.]|nr:7-carboxy-7-deazaguanine synthase QueE [Bdellovibrio sp.]
MVFAGTMTQRLNNLYLNSIYCATEGEGALIGRPQIFVRVQGCALGCVNCDSKDTWEFGVNPPCHVDDALGRISALAKQGLKRVSITGGDPLHPKHTPGVLQLARELKSRKFFISLEASGTRIVHEIFDLIDFINFDFKPPSTKIDRAFENQAQLIIELAQQYPGKFQIKSVVQDERDFTIVLKAYNFVLEKLGHYVTFDWCLTPVYNPGEAFPQERFKLILQLNENSGGVFRVIGQQHKWVYGPDEKQV